VSDDPELDEAAVAALDAAWEKDDLLRQDQLDILFHAVGRLIYYCTFMELWLEMSVGWMVPGRDRMYAHRELKPRATVKLLRDTAQGLPDAEREEFLEVLTLADEALDVRHAVVHGLWAPVADPTARISFRPSPSKKAVDQDGNPLSIRVRLTPEAVHEAAEKAGKVGGSLQAKGTRWGEMLDVDNSPPFDPEAQN